MSVEMFQAIGVLCIAFLYGMWAGAEWAKRKANPKAGQVLTVVAGLSAEVHADMRFCGPGVTVSRYAKITFNNGSPPLEVVIRGGAETYQENHP